MAGTDLANSSPVPFKPTSPRPRDHPAAAPPHIDSLLSSQRSPPLIQQVTFSVQDSHGGSAHGFLHLPSDVATKPTASMAAILLSGAGGGVTGPSGMYLALGTKLPALSARIPVLRLDYRYPARTKPCVADTKAAMHHLKQMFGIEQFVLVGWSFGGAPVYTVAGRDERVVGAATVASQTADAMTGARETGRRSVPALMLHGTGDRTLSQRCSESLYQCFWEGYKGSDEGKAKLVLFDNDDHALSKNAKKAEEMMAEFVVSCAGASVEAGEEAVVKSDVLKDRSERMEAMEKGGDLRGKEGAR